MSQARARTSRCSCKKTSEHAELLPDCSDKRDSISAFCPCIRPAALCEGFAGHLTLAVPLHPGKLQGRRQDGQAPGRPGQPLVLPAVSRPVASNETPGDSFPTNTTTVLPKRDNSAQRSADASKQELNRKRTYIRVRVTRESE